MAPKKAKTLDQSFKAQNDPQEIQQPMRSTTMKVLAASKSIIPSLSKKVSLALAGVHQKYRQFKQNFKNKAIIDYLDCNHEFWRFPYLPKEIRDEIWIYAIHSVPPRFIAICHKSHIVDTFHPTVVGQNPSFYYVCPESRSLLSKGGYSLIQNERLPFQSTELEVAQKESASAEFIVREVHGRPDVLMYRLPQKQYIGPTDLYFDSAKDFLFFSDIICLEWALRNPYKWPCSPNHFNWDLYKQLYYLNNDNDVLLRTRIIILDVTTPELEGIVDSDAEELIHLMSLKVWTVFMVILPQLKELKKVIVLSEDREDVRKHWQKQFNIFQRRSDIWLAIKNINDSMQYREEREYLPDYPWGNTYEYVFPQITVMSIT